MLTSVMLITLQVLPALVEVLGQLPSQAAQATSTLSAVHLLGPAPAGL